MTVWDGPTVTFWARGQRCEISFRVCQTAKPSVASKRLEVLVGGTVYSVDITKNELAALGLALLRLVRRKW